VAARTEIEEACAVEGRRSHRQDIGGPVGQKGELRNEVQLLSGGN
jgi:hypothetical protein